LRFFPRPSPKETGPFMTKSKNNPTCLKPQPKRRHSQGQNLVELAITLPFVVLMLFFIIELGRLWFTYEGTKVAAMEGAHAAAIYHSTQVGKTQMDNKIAAAGLKAKTTIVNQVTNQHAYEATVTVNYAPFFGGVSIPTLSGKIPIIPDQFDITYNAVEDMAIY
jgi:hypothetical protein